MTTTATHAHPAAHISAAATRPASRFRTWLRARLEAYVASNEEAFRVPERNVSLDITAH